MSALIIAFLFQTPEAARPQPAPWSQKIIGLDLNGALLSVAALVALTLALEWGGIKRPWGSGSVIGCLVAFGILVGLFVANEIWMNERALLVPRLMKQKTLALMSVFMTFSAASFFIVLYNLPIYFQSVDGVSAADSGVRNVPFILGVAIFSILTGSFIGVTGHYAGALALGSALIVIGAGLMLKLDIGSPSSAWIGYQVAVGIGSGMVVQAPIIVAQASADKADMSSVSAIILYFQTATAAIFIAVAQTLFTNKIRTQTAKELPELDTDSVIATGATKLRNVFSGDQLQAILRIYLAGLRQGYILAITCGGMALVIAIGVLIFDNRNLKKERKRVETAAQDEKSVEKEATATTD